MTSRQEIEELKAKYVRHDKYNKIRTRELLNTQRIIKDTEAQRVKRDGRY